MLTRTKSSCFFPLILGAFLLFVFESGAINSQLVYITAFSDTLKPKAVELYSAIQYGIVGNNPDSISTQNQFFHENGCNIRLDAILPFLIGIRYSNSPFQSNLNGFTVSVDKSAVEKINADHVLSKSRALKDEITDLDKLIAGKSQELAMLKEKGKRVIKDTLTLAKYHDSTRVESTLNSNIAVAYKAKEEIYINEERFHGMVNDSLTSILGAHTSTLDTVGIGKVIEKSEQQRSTVEQGVAYARDNAQGQSRKLDSEKYNIQNRIEDSQNLSEDIGGKISNTEDQIDSLKNKREQLQKLKKEMDLLLNRRERNQLYSSGLSGFVRDHLKSLSAGIIFPDFEDYIFNQSRLLGIELELEGRYYTAFSTGLLYTNRFFSPLGQSVGNGINALFGLSTLNAIGGSADFYTAGIKSGIGKKEGTHLYLGLLMAFPLRKQSSNVIDLVPRKNYVAELDAGFTIGKAGVMKLIVANSLSLDRNVTYVENNRIDIDRKSFAAGIVYNMMLKKFGTRLRVNISGAQPGFQSAGYTTLRTDQVAIGIGVQQRISKKFSTNLMLRKAMNNFSRTYGPQFTSDYLQITTNYRPLRRLTTVIVTGISKSSIQAEKRRLEIRTNNISFSAVYQPSSKSLHRIISTNASYINYFGLEGNSNISQLSLLDELKVNTNVIKGFNAGCTVQIMQTGLNTVSYYGCQIGSRLRCFKKCEIICGINPQLRDWQSFLWGFNSSFSCAILKSLQVDLGMNSNTIYDPLSERVYEQCTMYQMKFTYSI